jgi:ribonuclease P protein component
MKTGDSETPAKIGIIASRRFGGAVSRNRAKRKIREVFRRNQNCFPKGICLVALPRPGIFETSFSTFENRFVKAVEKLSF